MIESYKSLWAKSKPRHPLWKHLLDAAAVSLALDTAPPQGWSSKQVALIVGLHDVGKADAAFQHQVAEFSENLRQAGYPVTTDARCRHERISAWFLRNKLTGTGPYPITAVARAVLAHHGYWYEAARDVGSEYAKAQDELFDMLKEVLGVSELPNEIPSNLSAFGIRLAGRVVLCDWIASNEEFFTDSRLARIEDREEYFRKALCVGTEWIAKLGLERDKSLGKPQSVVSRARPIQEVLLRNCILPALVIIEAPMGEGKTEAAWILAEKWREQGYHGMYMALPTMATSDSLHRRYRDQYLKKLGRGEDAKLVHGMAWLRDEKEPKKPSEVGEPGDDRSLAAAWFRPTRRAMLAAHGVGTVDQAMLAGMHVKFGFLRLFGLADRVLVIDEVHAYDAYMSAIIGRLLQWCACLKIPVILLSATLSAKQRAAMLEAYGAMEGDPGPEAKYPLITVAEAGREAWTIEAAASSTRKLAIETHPGLLGDGKKTAAKAAEIVKDGGCCCVVLNTVKQAQAVYKQLRLPEAEKLLFHARFTAADRQRITEQVLSMFGAEAASRPEKFVLVATQVVEQSLDVDFDHMISDIAPIDLLLQRSGRIKRHARNVSGALIDGCDQRGEPVLHVLLPATEKKDKKGPVKKVEKPEFGASQLIYQRYPLLRTLEVLGYNKEIDLPDKFRPLIEAVYGQELSPDASEDLKTAEQTWNDLQEDLAAQAGEFLLCEPLADEFDPVGADEVGDDSDDGNGWRARTRLGLDDCFMLGPGTHRRARTRLGLEDVLVIPLSAKQVEKYKRGDLHPRLVKWLYQRSVKIPGWHWPLRAQANLGEQERTKQEPVLGQKKLRGVWLLPITKAAEGWTWNGERRTTKKDGKTEWKPVSFQYDGKLGLREDEGK